MKRRNFIALLGGAMAAWPVVARGQQSALRNIGIFFGSFNDGDPVAQMELRAFREGLAELGWHERSNISIVSRWGGGQIDRIRAIADEMAASGLDAIVARATPATAEIAKRTKTIPVVFVQVSDPVGAGLVKSFANPATNVTGFANLEASIVGKWLALLLELLPQLKRATMIYHPATTFEGSQFYGPPFHAAAAALGISPSEVAVESATQIEDAIASVGSGGAFISIPGSFLAGQRDTIIDAAARHHVPAVYAFNYWAQRGGLMSYGVDSADLFQRAAGYVDKILHGENPETLPVQTPNRFELVINLKTAKALGLTVPHTLLARADEAIE